MESGNNGETEIGKRTYRIAELMGLYIDCSFLIPMMISHLEDSESKSVPRYVTSVLTSLAAVIKNVGVKFSHHLEPFMN